jgi:hypothetical protein
MESCSLTGAIATGVGNLVELTTLNFASNALTGGIPDQITSLVLLRKYYGPLKAMTRISMNLMSFCRITFPRTKPAFWCHSDCSW